MTTVPTYIEFIEPVLKVLSQHPAGLKTSDAYEAVADKVGLTQAQREELLDSGRRPYYKDRISWAFDRLKRAGYGESATRGHWALTNKGVAFVQSHPQSLSDVQVRELASLGSRRSLRHANQEDEQGLNQPSEVTQDEVMQTPDEAMEWALEKLNQSVADELMGLVLALDPDQFEVLVLDVLLAMGYGADRRALARVGGSGDGGIDGIITLDRLGLEKVYVQAKRWAPGNTVGRPDIQGFYGALAARNTTKGVFITTSSFSTYAVEFAQQVSSGIVLVDGALLMQLMIEYGVGVSTHRVVKVVRVDSDYFEEV